MKFLRFVIQCLIRLYEWLWSDEMALKEGAYLHQKIIWELKQLEKKLF